MKLPKNCLPATLQQLISAADLINDFGQQFCPRSFSTAAKAWRFDANCTLAGVLASVNDDDGGPLSPDSVPVGKIRLLVDIEFFADNTSRDAICAENEVIDYAKGLGFSVAHESYVGSGEYGSINQLVLS
jgi:hypothetical protein